ncbi:hypothetical protein CR983_04240, partial [Candidatus Saccharibacteria bacterium]
RFQKGIDAILGLERDSRYQAACIFGSVAEGTSTDKSDLDVKVVVDTDNPCKNINHPTFDDYKLDITFHSFKQIEHLTRDQIKQGEREPNLVRAVVLFDKTGELTELQRKVGRTKPPRYTVDDYQFVQFLLYHANDKVERTLRDDPAASLYCMHANIDEIIKLHFGLRGHWRVSSKNVLKRLDEWDGALAQLVRTFVATSDIDKKYKAWSQIIDHVAEPMGGRQPITQNNCNCDACQVDLAAL